MQLTEDGAEDGKTGEDGRWYKCVATDADIEGTFG